MAYLQAQQSYLTDLLKLLMTKIDANGVEQLDGMRFLDWPSNANPVAINAGLQAMMVQAMRAGRELCGLLGDTALAAECAQLETQLIQAASKVAQPLLTSDLAADAPGQKQAAALLSLAGLLDAQAADQRFLSVNGAHGFSTFYGYYMLKAMAATGNYQGAMDVIRTYWGAMLDLGATTFWEDFNMNWLPNAARIDELVPAGKKDIHGDYGDYCYKGFRHSLCHGWASGPTAWLSQYVLGIEVVEPGCRIVRVRPNLGDLEWAEGSFPTPYGQIRVRHEKGADGQVRSQIEAPEQIQITY